MSQISKFIAHINQYLQCENIEDYSINGLQMGDGNIKIKKIGFAVNSTLLDIQAAIQANCQLLLVHHGLFWGKPIPLTDHYYKKIQLCVENSLAIGAYHLPLDLHPTLGNNIQIANLFDYQEIKYLNHSYKNQLGNIITLKNSLNLKTLIDLFKKEHIDTVQTTLSPSSPLSTIGILSGKLSLSLFETIKSENNLDLMITGETDLSVLNEAQDLNIPLMLIGHTQSEIFGIKALKNYINNVYPQFETVYLEAAQFLT